MPKSFRLPVQNSTAFDSELEANAAFRQNYVNVCFEAKHGTSPNVRSVPTAGVQPPVFASVPGALLAERLGQ
jgi:hypothetical protein